MMNPIVLKYLEEVSKVKAEVKAKQEREEKAFLKNKFDKPVGICYENGEVRRNLFSFSFLLVRSNLISSQTPLKKTSRT